MNKNIEFLDHIYQNAEMGIIGIDDILKHVDNLDMKKLIETQRKEYVNICQTTGTIYKKYGRDEKHINMMAKMGSKMSAESTLLTSKDKDKSIAKMMIEGSNKGIIEITEQINNNKDGDQEIIDLAKKLLKTEEYNLSEFKKYL